MTDEINSERRNQDEATRLCPRCESLEINKLLSPTRESESSLALGTIDHWHPASCALCKFLFELLPPDLASQLSNSYSLYSLKSRDSSEPLLQLLETRLLVLSTSDQDPPPTGIPYITVHPAQKPPIWRKRINPFIDFDQVREWLTICAKLHGDHCAGESNGNIDNLRLIDCKTGQVNKATRIEKYVALSYVWGHGIFERDTSKYPRTIQDAIMVTQRLGYSRLWVDQYCLDQNDHSDFQTQLQQMDSIYKQAAVTLIAAAGVNPEHGLPGVTGGLRPPTPSVKVKEQFLSPVSSIPKLSTSNCRWLSRAWTFQEGLLSTRRLIFTSTQVYFECQGMYSTEMLNIPLETWTKMHHRQHPYLHTRYRVAPNMGIFPLDGCGVDPWEIYPRIMEYSTRNLTHHLDILNGMLGIFRHFERTRHSIRHLYGIAYPQMCASSPNEVPTDAGSKNKIPIFSESLRWSLRVPGSRRGGFPSWSWTGWFGEVEWPRDYLGAAFPRRVPRKLDRPHDPKVNGNAIRVEVELRDESVVAWEFFQERYHELSTFDRLSGILRLEADTTRAVYMQEMQGSGMSVHLQCEDGKTITLEVERTTNREFKMRDPLLAVHFCRTVSRSRREESSEAAPNTNSRGGVQVNQHLLILQDMGSHWERVAIGTYVMDASDRLSCTRQCLRLG